MVLLVAQVLLVSYYIRLLVAWVCFLLADKEKNEDGSKIELSAFFRKMEMLELADEIVNRKASIGEKRECEREKKKKKSNLKPH